jgi:hypothetical protein
MPTRLQDLRQLGQRSCASRRDTNPCKSFAIRQMNEGAVNWEAGNKNAVLNARKLVIRIEVSAKLCHLEGSSMRAAPYDIFRKDLLGTPVWMEAVQDIETAKLRVTELAGRSPAEYFVFSQETQEIVSSTAPRLFELAV